MVVMEDFVGLGRIDLVFVSFLDFIFFLFWILVI